MAELSGWERDGCGRVGVREGDGEQMGMREEGRETGRDGEREEGSE